MSFFDRRSKVIKAMPVKLDPGPKPIAFERATEVMATWLARFRDENAEPTDNDRLMAGHIAGALWANDLLNTTGENWETVSSETPL